MLHSLAFALVLEVFDQQDYQFGALLLGRAEDVEIQKDRIRLGVQNQVHSLELNLRLHPYEDGLAIGRVVLRVLGVLDQIVLLGSLHKVPRPRLRLLLLELAHPLRHLHMSSLWGVLVEFERVFQPLQLVGECVVWEFEQGLVERFLLFVGPNCQVYEFNRQRVFLDLEDLLVGRFEVSNSNLLIFQYFCF